MMKTSRVSTLFLLVGLLYAGHLQGEVVLVVNDDLGISKVSRQNVENLYLGRTRFLKGKRVKLTNNLSVLEGFLKNILSRSPRSYQSIWRMQVFTGKAREPRRLKNSKELFQWMSHDEEVIGYAERSEVPEGYVILEVEP